MIDLIVARAEGEECAFAVGESPIRVLRIHRSANSIGLARGANMIAKCAASGGKTPGPRTNVPHEELTFEIATARLDVGIAYKAEAVVFTAVDDLDQCHMP